MGERSDKVSGVFSSRDISAQFQPALDVVELARQCSSLRREAESGGLRPWFGEKLSWMISQLASVTSSIANNPQTAVLIPDLVEITGLIGSAKSIVDSGGTKDFAETMRRITDQLLIVSERLTIAAQQASGSITDAVRRRSR